MILPHQQDLFGIKSHIRKRATAFALAHVINELTIEGDK
jgi:hypothetical protein